MLRIRCLTDIGASVYRLHFLPKPSVVPMAIGRRLLGLTPDNDEIERIERIERIESAWVLVTTIKTPAHNH